MDFFESQDSARRNTGRLILLFGLAVISLILVTNFLVMLIFGFLSTEMTSAGVLTAWQFNWQVFVMVGVLVAAVIILGSLYKIVSLSGGGARVAEMMNGRLLVAGTGDLLEQRLMNVVEEMAIASGTPVPPIYVLEEAGINAFAAGYSPSDAVIGVTRGAIETLNREQLQGVVAHEFSHILHGDMRINIRLIGILHGIMVLGIIGYYLMRGSSFRSRSKDSGGVVMLGLGLLVIGYVGTFFGNLIKAAVSRQREFLADASSVQFTRNPQGIATALMRIGQHSQRSYMAHPSSREISHALFEEGTHSALSGLHATHPPLEKRISAILPDWDGNMDLPPEVQHGAVQGEGETQSAAGGPAGLKSPGALTGVVVADALLNQIGNPSPMHLAYAEGLLARLPSVWIEAAREPSGARAVVYLLAMAPEDPTRRRQFALLQDSADVGVAAEVERLAGSVDAIAAEMRLPLLEICLGSLRQLSGKQYKLFKTNFSLLIELDKKVNLLEWSMQKLVFHHLDDVFEAKRRRSLGKGTLEQNKGAIDILLSIIARATSQENATPEEAFLAGAEALSLEGELLDAASISFGQLNGALDNLAKLKPLLKPRLLKACVATIQNDQAIKPLECELLRAVAAIIDCPVPPLVADSP